MKLTFCTPLCFATFTLALALFSPPAKSQTFDPATTIWFDQPARHFTEYPRQWVMAAWAP